MQNMPQQKHQVKRTVKPAKRIKETNIATICKSNAKYFYSYINERRIVREKVGPLKTPDGIVVTKDNVMANNATSAQCSSMNALGSHSTARPI